MNAREYIEMDSRELDTIIIGFLTIMVGVLLVVFLIGLRGGFG